MSDISISERHVGHHWDTAEQEESAARLGMWIFIGQEFLFFGTLFVAYIIFRVFYPDMFREASEHLSWKLGALNTVFLILSSFSMVLAIRSAQTNKLKNISRYLWVTFLFALAFLVVKGFEYDAKIVHGLLPSKWFSAAGHEPTLHLFFGMYFAFTGLHALHVIVGMALILWLIRKANRGQLYPAYHTPLEMVSLYWHTVELIWIFLFPCLYFVG